MKLFLNLTIFFLLACVLILPSDSFSAYQMAPSTGNDLPYSVQTRNLLKHLFNNRTVIGGQVIAVKGSEGKQFNGNYLDVGELGGVKKDDVFALFTPQGEPVGFAQVVETQHYTSTFKFFEMTVELSNNLIAKKATEEVRVRLPNKLMISPDMRNWGSKTKLASTKKKPAGSSAGVAQANGSSQGVLPPLPSNSTMAASTGSNLPPLPSNNDNGTGNALPPLPGSGVASTDNSGLTPLPMNDSTSPGGSLPPLTTNGDAGNNLPPLSGDNAGALPPLETDNSSSGLPALPSDNSAAPTSLPDSSNSGGLPPLSGDVGAPPMSSTGAPDSGLPVLPTTGDSTLPPSVPEGSSSNALPALPGNDNQSALPPLGASDMSIPPAPGGDSTLQPLPSVPPAGAPSLDAPASTPGDMTLPPLPGDTPANQGTPMLPPQSSLPLDSSSSMASANGLPSDIPAAPPSLDNNTLLAPTDMSLPPVADASLPGQPAIAPADSSIAGLPSMDNSSAPPALADISLPPASDNSSPGQPPAALSPAEVSPMAVAALPPDIGQVPPPALDSSLNGLPAISPEPSGINNEAALPPALNPPASEDLSPPAIVSGTATSTSIVSHSINLGLPVVPTDVKTGFLQDIPTLSPAIKPAA